MQRTGRKGHAMFRLVVQESRFTPTSGKVVALLGSYDPHSKNASLDKDKAGFYLTNGAQPSNRAALLLQKEGVDLPKWVKLAGEKKRGIRNPDKLRRNQAKPEPEEPAVEETADAPEAETGTVES
ncbi:MAG TPA: 30S ribosomal protein S16 [Candidatus Limnocylindrales bacterium]|nr:30S ribosomal protein S16 [Candidatus Limnocylindrales bacterium]